MTGGHAPDTRAGAHRPDPDEDKCTCEGYDPDPVCRHSRFIFGADDDVCFDCGAHRDCPIHGEHEDTREPIRDEDFEA